MRQTRHKKYASIKVNKKKSAKHEKYDIFGTKVYPNTNTRTHAYAKQKAKTNHLLHMWPDKAAGVGGGNGGRAGRDSK